MPIYEYSCRHCGASFELLQKISDKPEKRCIHCGRDGAIRLVSAAGFQLKGSGWYATDFKSTPAKKETKTTPNSTTESNKN